MPVRRGRKYQILCYTRGGGEFEEVGKSLYVTQAGLSVVDLNNKLFFSIEQVASTPILFKGKFCFFLRFEVAKGVVNIS